MKLDVFPNTCARAGVKVMEAFVESLLNSGEDVRIYEKGNYGEGDCAVIWSVLWLSSYPTRKKIWEHYKQQSKKVIVLEVGGLIRNKTWRIAIDGINAEATFPQASETPDRFHKLGLNLQPWNQNGEAIIVCGQNTLSNVWPSGLSTKQFFHQTVASIRKVTDRPIILRPHPRAADKAEDDYGKGVTYQIPKRSGGYDDFDFEQALSKAYGVISYNSNPGLQSVLNGVPVWTHESSLAFSMASGNLNDIGERRFLDREKWAWNLAWKEFTVEEIKDGLPWKRLRDFL